MLTLSILWVVLAAAVTVSATLRHSAVAIDDKNMAQSNEPGRGVAILAIASSILLLAGVLVVGGFLVSGLSL